MTVIAHHAGEELLLVSVGGSGLASVTLLFVRARLAALVRRRRRL